MGGDQEILAKVAHVYSGQRISASLRDNRCGGIVLDVYQLPVEQPEQCLI